MWIKSSSLIGEYEIISLPSTLNGVCIDNEDNKLRHNATLPKGTTIDLNDPTDWLLPAVHAHVGEY